MDDGYNDTSVRIATHFSGIAVASTDQSQLSEVVRMLAAGAANHEVLRTLVERRTVDGDLAFKSQTLKLVLDFVDTIVADGAFSAEEESDVLALRQLLRVDEGDFATHCPAEVEAILGRELDRIVNDGTIDNTEELYQVSLQRALGLGYDDYLRLTQRSFERVFHQLSAAASSESQAAAVEASRKLRLIEPVYRLSAAAVSADRPE